MSWFLYIFLFVLPFERIPSVDVGGITVRISSVLLALFAVIVVPQLLAKKKTGPIDLLDKLILGFLAAVGLSVIGSADLHRSLVVLALLSFVLLGYLLMSRLISNERLLTTARQVIIVSALITAVFGLFQFFGDSLGFSNNITGLMDRYTRHVFGFPRIQSVGVEPLYYANFLLLPIFLLLGNILFDKTPIRRNFLILGIILTVFTLTLSRGAFIAFLIGSVVLLVIALREKVSNKLVTKTLLTIVASFLIGLACIAAVSGLSGVKAFGSQSSIVDAPVQASAATRLDHFRQAWKIFKTDPVNGVGIGAYDAVSAFPDTPTDQGRQIVNNQYLETLAETGIVGFITLLSVGVAALWSLYQLVRRKANLAFSAALLCALLAVAIQYNFFSTIYILFGWVLLGLVGATIRIEKNG